MVSGLAGGDIFLFVLVFVFVASTVGWFVTGNPFVGIAGFALGISGIVLVSIGRVAGG